MDFVVPLYLIWASLQGEGVLVSLHFGPSVIGKMVYWEVMLCCVDVIKSADALHKALMIDAFPCTLDFY